MEWMAMAAFLGALYCAVLGVFKRFRASMTFSMAEMEAVNVQEPTRAVYRPFSSDAVYSFNAVQESNHFILFPYGILNWQRQCDLFQECRTH